MAAQNYYKDVRHVVHITSHIEQPCEHCSATTDPDDFGVLVNHYIEKHGYKLLHVGTETSCDTEGRPWHATVALVGK